MTTPYAEGHPRNVQAFRETLDYIIDDHRDLLIAKNQDYGDNLLRFGLRGVLMRISDKYQRLENLIMHGHEAMVMETIEQTLQDLSGYALVTLAHLEMGDMTLDGVWGEREPSVLTPPIPEEWIYRGPSPDVVTTSWTAPCDYEWEALHDGD
jgi:hypothetical protein